MSDIQNIINSEFIKKQIASGQRIDKRGFEDFRKLDIKVGVMKSADGSAWVKLGDTEVIAGIKFAVGTPYPDSLDSGSMTLNLELTGLASPDYQTGPPQLDSVEFGRVADRAIRHSGAIDFKELCIVPGEKVFIVFIDCYAINAAGNLIDATEIAAIAALMDTKIPKLDDKYAIIQGEYSGKLDIKCLPLSLTFEKVGDKIILDATDAEEYVSDVRFSLGIVGNNVLSCHKSKGGTLDLKDVDKMLDIATSKYFEIAKTIENSVNAGEFK